ncbi:semaphorin-5A isoform X2 [Nematostella vectensis]|nr:semaphorin-5A isoform X2 [Nematostella vectensis]
MKECWGSANARVTYNKLGCNDNCKRRDDGKFGVGTAWSNFVYRVKNDWTDCTAKVCGHGIQYKLVLSQDKGPKCPTYNVMIKRSDATRNCRASKPCGKTDFESVGCYKDSLDRALPKYLGQVGPYDHTTGNFKEVFSQCKSKAKAAGMVFFGLQNKKECWAGDTNASYDKHGCAGNCYTCPDGRYGLGRGWSNYVYMFKQDWGVCSKTCGGGQRSRYETEFVSGEPSCKAGTRKSVLKKQACSTTPCAVDGGWSSFSGWSSCSKTCGSGTQSRARTCTNPRPAHGGKDCVGDAQETVQCATRPCPARCPGGWRKFQDSCYWSDARHMSWYSARSTCLSLGGDLVKISSSQENSFVARIKRYQLAWIGLKKQGSWFRWVVDNSPPRFAQWAPGEPSNLNMHELCCAIGYKGVAKWDDGGCGGHLGFICERKVNR